MSLSFSQRIKRFSVALAATALACSTVTFSTATASADPHRGADAVFFGDSFFANPGYKQVAGVRSDLVRAGLSSIEGSGSEAGAPSPQGCPQGKKTVAAEYGKITGRSVANYACSAAKASGGSFRKDFDQQVVGAIANKHLTADTKNVFVQFGANNLQDIAVSQFNNDSYRQAMVNNTNRIRQAAPHATITFVGYPAISAANGAMCPVRSATSSEVGFNMDVLGLVRLGEDTINSAMRTAASAAGANYVDLRRASIDHNMCAPDSIRWVSGISERSVTHNLSNHLTHAGVDGVARILSARS